MNGEASNAPSDLKEACRIILFETLVEGFEVATYGGTLFVVVFDGVPYGLTARHNRHDFEWKDLLVTQSRWTKPIAGLSAVSYPGTGLHYADGSDLLDLAIVHFSNDIDSSYFNGSSFDFAKHDLYTSKVDDDLVVYGALSEYSRLEDRNIFAQFSELGFVDTGANKHDPVLREAKGLWLEFRPPNLAGLSGAPVFNVTRNGLAGMCLRGGISTSGLAQILYMDIADIIRVLWAVHHGQSSGQYFKMIKR